MLRAKLAARLPSTMLFKTLSASVYGIDAYLVEVEVDVGSARMQDFNVVGLPDNAVKESRERIKSALRNCGFEFPHGPMSNTDVTAIVNSLRQIVTELQAIKHALQKIAAK
jgi:hypothetical protein